jgi:hypothetical protein
MGEKTGAQWLQAPKTAEEEVMIAVAGTAG